MPVIFPKSNNVPSAAVLAPADLLDCDHYTVAVAFDEDTLYAVAAFNFQEIPGTPDFDEEYRRDVIFAAVNSLQSRFPADVLIIVAPQQDLPCEVVPAFNDDWPAIATRFFAEKS
jgi:hypothetical protein